MSQTACGVSARDGKDSPHHDRAIVDADSLPRKALWKFHRIDFQLKALEEINRAAYWDYQHEKVTLRSSAHQRKLSGMANKKQTRIRVDKVVNWPEPAACPGCGCKKLYRYRKDSKCLIDIRFRKDRNQEVGNQVHVPQALMHPVPGHVFQR